MPQLCRFVELPSNTVIFINPMLVEYVKPATSGAGAFVYFAKEHLVWVDVSAERAAQALENALKPAP
ncbi:MAG: hypothetical protein ACREC1_05250, partial [Methylovirgula sp.]